MKLEIIENKNLVKYVQKTVLQRIAFPFNKYWKIPDDKIYVLQGNLYAHPKIIERIRESKK